MKVEPEWKAMHGVADKRIKQVADIYEKALINLRNSVDVDRLSQEPIPMMADKIDWQKFEDDCDKAYEVLGLVLIDGGNVAAKYLSNKLMTKINHNIVAKRDVSMPTFGGGSPEGLSLTGSFDMRNPRAAAWASQHVGENIRQVNQASKDGIRQILTDAQQYGGHPYETARQIRQFIGLTDRQISGILKYQGKLDEEGRPKAQVDRMVDAQIRRKIRARANTIARTETIAASAAGQQLHWEDQMSKGYLNNNEMEKVWIVTPDDKLCPICAAMGDERTAIDGTFTFGGKAPPRHPNCRCAIGLEEKKGMELEGYMDSDKGKDWTNVDQLLGLPPEATILPAMTEELKGVIKRYTTGGYKSINAQADAYLMGTPKEKAFSKNAEALFDEVNASKQKFNALYRIERIEGFEVVDEVITKNPFEQGQELIWGLRSTSKDEKFIAQAAKGKDKNLPFVGGTDYKNKVVYRIKNATGLDVTDISPYNQSEVIVSGKYKVSGTSIENIGKQKVIVVDILPADGCPGTSTLLEMPLQPTDKEIKSVKEYTSASYNGINSYLRTGGAINKEYAQSLVDDIDSFISKSPKLEVGKTLFRGADLDSVLMNTDSIVTNYKVTDENAALLKRKLMGKTYEDKAFTSTGEKLINHYVGNVEMRILTTEKAKGVLLTEISDVKNEGEVLLARGAKMKVTNVVKEGKKFVVFLTY